MALREMGLRPHREPRVDFIFLGLLEGIRGLLEVVAINNLRCGSKWPKVGDVDILQAPK